MSNSPLVNYIKISPNKTSPRKHKIDTITIHCAVGQLSVEALGRIFEPSSRKASSNYGIGFDGKIGMYVEEKDRSWCSSSAYNDNRAITIECASDTKHPYAINKDVYNSLIKLLVDICKRNDIKELKWKADKKLIGQPDKQNMTVHRWFANKACPGDYIYNRLGQIANEVNSQLCAKDEQNGKNSQGNANNEQKENFIVKVSIPNLNIRTGPGTNFSTIGKYTGIGMFTIVETKEGEGSNKGWGKLKSGLGWISLDHVTKN